MRQRSMPHHAATMAAMSRAKLDARTRLIPRYPIVKINRPTPETIEATVPRRGSRTRGLATATMPIQSRTVPSALSSRPS